MTKKKETVDFETLGERYDELKGIIDTCEKERKEIKAVIEERVHAEFGDNEGGFFPSYGNKVIGIDKRVSLSMDNEKLEKLLSEEQWEAITDLVRQINNNKLSLAIDGGVIPQKIIQKCTVERVTFAIAQRKVAE